MGLRDLFLAALLAGVIALFLNWLALRRGFFELPEKVHEKRTLLLRDLLAIFGIYLLISLVISPLIFTVAKKLYDIEPNSAKTLTYLMFFNASLILILFFAYIRRLDRKTLRDIFKRPSSTSSWKRNIGIGLLAYCLSLPIVIAFHQLLEGLTVWIFGKKGEVQTAVKLVQLIHHDPLLLILGFFSIMIAAPLIEEIIFRGFFQTYLRQRFGRNAAIYGSSILFTLVHFSWVQGIGNVALLGALFPFALFLGFVYEKERSLLAPIILHMTFNAISVIRIFLTQRL